MIKLTKDYITKLYLILVVFILVLIVCCIVTNPATAFALDDKIQQVVPLSYLTLLKMKDILN